MSFQAPLFLLGLAVDPARARGAVLARRRAGAVRRPLPRDGRRSPRSSPQHGPRCAAHPARAAVRWRSPGWRSRSRGPRRRRRAGGARVGDARDRHVGLDERRPTSRPPRLAAAQSGRRRASSTACPTRCRSAWWPTPTARTPCSARRRTASEVEPTLDGARAPTAAPPPATRSTRALTGARRRATRSSPPAAIVLLSDGAIQDGPRPGRGRPRRPAPRGVPIYTVALGTADGVVERPAASVLPVPPDPEALARGRADLRRPRVRGRGRRRARRGLRDARLADRHQEGEAGDQRRLRRRRAAAARRRARSPRCAGAGGCRRSRRRAR